MPAAAGEPRLETGTGSLGGRRVLFVLFMGVSVAAIVGVLGLGLLRLARRPPGDPGPLVGGIVDALPGGNCGACGNDSCFKAASAVARGRAPSTVCVKGGPATALAVAKVLRSHTGGQVG
jgi:Na+-translocating ferredoxin:NAD+ oxidoreductase subunit B